MDYTPRGLIPLYSVEYSLTKNEFVQGFLTFQRRFGRAREGRLMALVLLGLLAINIPACMYRPFDVQNIILIVLILLTFFAVVVYVFSIVPEKIRSRAGAQYTQSLLLSAGCAVTVCRDVLVFTSPYQKRTYYYSEMITCIETKSLFLFVENIAGDLVIIPRRVLPNGGEEAGKLFKEEFAGRYTKLRG